MNAQGTLSKAKNAFSSKKESGIFLVFVLMVVIFTVLSPNFMTVKNILNVLRQVSLNGILAMGMTMVILLGDIDLSAGATYFISSVTCAMLVTKAGVGFLPAILLGVLAAGLFGLVNGVLVAKIGLPAFIATLGTMNVARGLGQTLSGGYVISMTKEAKHIAGYNWFSFLGTGRIFGNFPMMAIFLILITAIAFILVHKTLFGFYLKAMGGNRNAAKVVGINTAKIRVLAFTIEGILCGIGGILALSWIGSCQGNTGDGAELDAIAATIIGGTSANGGEGSIIGTLIGVFIMGVLKNGLVLIGVSGYIQTAVVGAVIILSVALDILSSRRKG